MGDLSDKLEDGLAKFAAIDEELDAVLKDMGLPGLAEAAEGADDVSAQPAIMVLCTIQSLEERHAALRNALLAGADPNERCPWGAMALDTLYTDGDAGGLALLLDFDADASDYQWSDAHLAVIRNDHDGVAAMSDDALRATDRPGDTPFLLACRLGLLESAQRLLCKADLLQAAMLAARRGSIPILQMLQDNGLDLNLTFDDGSTLLLDAVEAGQVDMVAYLLQNGADIEAVRRAEPTDKPLFGTSEKLQQVVDKMMSAVADLMPGPAGPLETTIYDAAYDPAVVRLLVAYGADAAKFQDELFPVAIGVDHCPRIPISRHEFAAQYTIRFGRSNPERVDIPFWTAQIRSCQSAYLARSAIVGSDAQTDGPVWSFDRFGRTATRLADGRLVLIAGEHEDHYDPDFCIYNDVTVIGPDASITHYTYPAQDFPPTDFHTATLDQDGIWIIGNLGYARDRRPGQTQVLWLSLTDFSIHRIATKGQGPGWIHGHRATLQDGGIYVTGGRTEPGDREMQSTFVLDLKTRTWHALN